jgi:hypothetical protein
MSDSTNPFGSFGKLVPGFDFLQNLAKGASGNIPQMPNLGNWVAPTINVDELEKRIDELKAVQFWLDQNAAALKATIQALEVQKMTLATLKGMNFSMGDVANAFKLKAADAVKSFAAAMPAPAAAPEPVAEPEPEAEPAPELAPAKKAARKAAAPAGGVVDPMQWWGSLTQQFQNIAASALKDAAKQTAIDTTRNLATGLAKGAVKTATGMAMDTARSVGKSMGSATKKVAKGGASTRTPAAKTSKPRSRSTR